MIVLVISISLGLKMFGGPFWKPLGDPSKMVLFPNLDFALRYELQQLFLSN